MLQSQTILQDRRVLIVEDEAATASDLEATFAELGCSAVVVAATMSMAISMIDTFAPEFALVDFRIGRGTSGDVIAKLTERGVPFALATGAGHDELLQFQDAPIASMPFSSMAIEMALISASAGSAGFASMPVARSLTAR